MESLFISPLDLWTAESSRPDACSGLCCTVEDCSRAAEMSGCQAAPVCHAAGCTATSRIVAGMVVIGWAPVALAPLTPEGMAYARNSLICEFMPTLTRIQDVGRRFTARPAKDLCQHLSAGEPHRPSHDPLHA